MIGVNRKAATLNESPPRRFILLPEEPMADKGQGRQIRRYRLTTLGQGARRTRPGLGTEIPAVRGMGKGGAVV